MKYLPFVKERERERERERETLLLDRPSDLDYICRVI